MKRTLVLGSLVTFLLATPVMAGINDGLVAYYPLDGNAHDASGGGRHGDVNGAVPTADRSGNPNNAYSFDGDDYITVDSDIDFGVGEFSIAVWFKQNTNEPWRMLVSKHEGKPGNNDAIMLAGSTGTLGELAFQVCDSDNCGGSYSSEATYNDNQWHHVAGIRTVSSTLLYVDGLLVGSEPTTNFDADAANGLKIGARGDLGAGCGSCDTAGWYGSIDEVRIYDHALSQSEIEELYDGGGSGGEPNLEYSFTVNNGQPVVSGNYVPVRVTVKNTGAGTWDGGPVQAHFFWVDEKDRGNDSFWNILYGWFGGTYTDRGHWFAGAILDPIPPGGEDSTISLPANAFAAHFIDRAAVKMMDPFGNTLPGAREIRYNDEVDVRFNYADASLNCAGTLITAITGGLASSTSSETIKFMYESASAGIALNSIAGQLNEHDYWNAGIETITFITELGLNINPVSGFALTAFKEVSFLLPIGPSGPGGCGTLLAASGVEGYNFLRAALAEENRVKANTGLANLAQVAIALQGSGRLRVEDPEGRVTVVDTSDLCTEGIPDSICISMGELAMASFAGGTDGYKVTAGPDSNGTLLLKVLKLTTGGVFPMSDAPNKSLTSEPTTDEFVWSVSVEGSDELLLTLDSSNQLMLGVDRGGNGTIDETLAPTVTVIDPTQDHAFSYWLDAAAHLPGMLSSQWRTDVVARNIGAGSANVQFNLHSSDGVKQFSNSVSAGDQGAFTDVVGLMGYEGKGCLEVLSNEPLQVSGRIFNLGDEGTFGQYVEAYTSAETLNAGESGTLLQLRQKEGDFRTNIAVTNTGTAPASVRVRLYNSSGLQLKQYTLNIGAETLKQDQEPFKQRANQPNLGWGFAEVEVLSGSGILASASVVDSVTNDATTIPFKR